MQRYMYEYVRHMPLHLLQPCTAGSVFMRRTRLLLGHAVCLFCILLLFFYLFCIILVIPYNTYRFTLFYLFSQYSALFLLGFPFATLRYLRSCLHSFLSFLHYLLSRLLSLSLVSLSPLSLISMNYILTRHAFSHLHELHSHQTRALYCTYCMSTCINHHLTLSCPLCLPINLFLQPTFSLGLYYFVVLY